MLCNIEIVFDRSRRIVMINHLKHPNTSALVQSDAEFTLFGIRFKYVPTRDDTKWNEKKAEEMAYTLPCWYACIEFCWEKKCRPSNSPSHMGTGARQLLFETRLVCDAYYLRHCACWKIVSCNMKFSATTAFVPLSFIHLRSFFFLDVKFLNLCASSLCQCRNCCRRCWH